MLDKVKLHFLSLGAHRFVKGTVILLIILDIINSLYLRIFWGHRGISRFIVERIANNQGMEFHKLSEQTVSEITRLVDNAFFFLLFIILVNNLFFYFFYLRRKLWAQSYVLFYAVSSSIMAISFVFEGPILGWTWFLYNLSTMFLYLYLYLGVKVLKHETTDPKLSPAYGKQGL